MHNQQFYIFVMLEGMKDIWKFPTRKLMREVVNMAQVPEYDLFRTMKFNTQGILKRIIKPIEENSFMKLRQISI